MRGKFRDPIVEEVRRNRKALLADFNGDINKLDEYLISKRAEREMAGIRYAAPHYAHPKNHSANPSTSQRKTTNPK